MHYERYDFDVDGHEVHVVVNEGNVDHRPVASVVIDDVICFWMSTERGDEPGSLVITGMDWYSDTSWADEARAVRRELGPEGLHRLMIRLVGQIGHDFSTPAT